MVGSYLPCAASAKGQRRKGRRDSCVLASSLVRILAIVVAGLVALAPVGARADQRQDLQQKGEQQAKDGRFAEAIESFKAADRIQPRASHACLIALAYTRRELWSQAQLWLTDCFSRANASDPLPDWASLAEKQIKERLQTANVVEVTIEVRPASAKAKVTVSSFAPDEVFEARTIHLTPGTHVVFAKAEGYPDRQQTIELRDKTPQRVVIDFGDATQAQPPVGGRVDPGTALPMPPERRSRPSNTLSNGLLISGGVAIVLGGVVHLVMSGARKDMIAATHQFNTRAATAEFMALPPADMDMERANALTKYRDAENRFDRARVGAITLYAVGAGLAVTGYLIRKKYNAEAPAVSAVPLPEGGGFVAIGWAR